MNSERILSVLRQLIIAVALFFSTQSYAQTCEETEFVVLSQVNYAGNPYNENFFSRKIENYLYIIKTGNMSFLIQGIGDFDTLWRMDVRTNKIDFLLIANENLRKGDENELGKDFYVTNKNLYIIGNKELFIYKKTETGFVYIQKEKLKHKYAYILGEIENHLIFFEAFNYHPFDQSEKVVISTYSLQTNKIVKSIFPEMRGIELTYSNKRFCDIYKNTILYAQPFKNAITIYNLNLDTIGTVNLLNAIDDTVNLKTKEYSTDEVQRILMADMLYNRNVKIDVLGDTLLVMYKKKFQNFRRSVWFDIYTYKEKNWTICDSAHFISFDFDSTKNITPSTQPASYIVDNNQIIVDGGFTYEVSNRFIAIDKPLTYKEYLNKVDFALFNHEFGVAVQKQPLKCLFR